MTGIVNILEPTRDAKSAVIVPISGDAWNLVVRDGVYKNVPRYLLEDFLSLRIDSHDPYVLVAYVEEKDFMGHIIMRRLPKTAMEKIAGFMKIHGISLSPWAGSA